MVNKIIICVSGGTVQNVYAQKEMDYEVEVLDYDILKECDPYGDYINEAELDIERMEDEIQTMKQIY
jgi:hypothetical protein